MKFSSYGVLMSMLCLVSGRLFGGMSGHEGAGVAEEFYSQVAEMGREQSMRMSYKCGGMPRFGDVAPECLRLPGSPNDMHCSVEFHKWFSHTTGMLPWFGVSQDAIDIIAMCNRETTINTMCNLKMDRMCQTELKKFSMKGPRRTRAMRLAIAAY